MMIQLIKIVKLIFVTGILAAITLKAISVSVIPEHLYYFTVPIVIVGLYLWMAKGQAKEVKYSNEQGYVVLSHNNEFEHRHIAKEILKRNLLPNEVVHHINGKRNDNSIRNLCVMDREKHKHFHAWLRWNKEKSGEYPQFSDQKKSLVTEYGGTLLENVAHQSAAFKLDRRIASPQRNLFNELKRERKRIAEERNIPVYIIFDNATLNEMANRKPVTNESLLQIRGVGPVKLRMYGDQFISVIKKHKTQSSQFAKGTA